MMMHHRRRCDAMTFYHVLMIDDDVLQRIANVLCYICVYTYTYVCMYKSHATLAKYLNHHIAVNYYYKMYRVHVYMHNNIISSLLVVSVRT